MRGIKSYNCKRPQPAVTSFNHCRVVINIYWMMVVTLCWIDTILPRSSARSFKIRIDSSIPSRSTRNVIKIGGRSNKTNIHWLNISISCYDIYRARNSSEGASCHFKIHLLIHSSSHVHPIEITFRECKYNPIKLQWDSLYCNVLIAYKYLT